MQGNLTLKNEVCYTGGIYDRLTGKYYLNARYYSPETGRFLTEDTYRGELEEPETQHLYAYCTNDPVDHVDPSGNVVLTIATYGAWFEKYSGKEILLPDKFFPGKDFIEYHNDMIFQR